MITITETVIKPRKGLLEPTYVRYLIRPLQVRRFEPVLLGERHGITPVRHRLRPQVAALYGTNASPRDRMRHDYRWRGRKNPTGRYTAIDPRQR
jgi:hypothetical protein